MINVSIKLQEAEKGQQFKKNDSDSQMTMIRKRQKVRKLTRNYKTTLNDNELINQNGFKVTYDDILGLMNS